MKLQKKETGNVIQICVYSKTISSIYLFLHGMRFSFRNKEAIISGTSSFFFNFTSPIFYIKDDALNIEKINLGVSIGFCLRHFLVNVR